MKHFADACMRALFARRYGPVCGGTSAGDTQTIGLASDGMSAAIGAGFYRLVVGIEALVEAARQRLRRRTPGIRRRPTSTPAACA